MATKALVRRPKGEGIEKRWWIVALAVFFVCDVILVAGALNANRIQNDGKPPLVPSSSATASQAMTPPVVSGAVPPQRVLAAVSAEVAWRGTIGPCPDGPSDLEYTVDGGVSWKKVNPAQETGATTLVRVIPESPSVANVVTLDAGCKPQLVGTFVAGEVWADYTSNLGSYWYVDPGDRSTVHGPSGRVSNPCASAVTIATRSTSDAAVLCEDQMIFVTNDGGAAWSPVTVPGAIALAGSRTGYVITVARQNECAGISTVTLLGSGPSTPVGCVGERPSPGQTAIAASDDGTFWLWTGSYFARSIDGGLTWN